MIVQDRKKVPGLALYLYERAKDSSGEIPDTTRRITVDAKLIEKFPQLAGIKTVRLVISLPSSLGPEGWIGVLAD